MQINRVWAMPDKNTFKIKPIKSLISKLVIRKTLMKQAVIIDPFVNNSPFKGACVTNDIDPAIEADYHMDALGFLRMFDTASVDMVLFDPPYSPRQVSECYKKLNRTVNMQTTQVSFWVDLKQEIGRITKQNGIVVSCGWNSGEIGRAHV